MWRVPKSLIVLLLVSVCALFFFPLDFGSYQSTHGPTAPQNPAIGLLFLVLMVAGPVAFGVKFAVIGRAVCDKNGLVVALETTGFRILRC